MKKQLLSFALLSVLFANAQVWTENFNSVSPPNLPLGWAQINGDGLNPHLSIYSYNFGINAGVTKNLNTLNIYGFGNALVSTSYYTPLGTSNDWIITPSFSVPPNAVFSWVATSLDVSYTEVYEVRVSTTGNLQSDFLANPSLYITLGEVYNPFGGFSLRSVDLGAYTGQTIYLAIHDFGNDKYLVFGITKRTDPDTNKYNTESGAVKEKLLEERRSMTYDAYLDSIKKKMKSEGKIIVKKDIIDKLFQEMAAPPAQ